MFSLRQDLNDGIEFLDLKSIGVNTQTLPNYFIDAGQFYWGKVATWVNQNQVLNPSSVPIVLERWETIDIDYPEDLEVAVAILIKRESKEGK
jgi:N-acylneuraminate cytidylyltransferase